MVAIRTKEDQEYFKALETLRASAGIFQDGHGTAYLLAKRQAERPGALYEMLRQQEQTRRPDGLRTETP